MQFSTHSSVSLLKKIKIAPDIIQNLLILYVQNNTLEDELYSLYRQDVENRTFCPLINGSNMLTLLKARLVMIFKSS